MARWGRPSKFSPRADHKMLKEVSNNPKMSSRDLQVALATVDVKEHTSTIRKRLHKFDFHWRCARRKPLLSKKNIRARLKFARAHLDKDQDFWNNVLWTDESNLNYLYAVTEDMFDTNQRQHLSAWTSYQLWRMWVEMSRFVAAFTAAGPGQLTTIASTMNSL